MSVSKTLIFLLGASVTDIASADHHGHYGNPYTTNSDGDFTGLECGDGVTLDTDDQKMLSATTQCSVLFEENFPDFGYPLVDPETHGLTGGLCAPFGGVWHHCADNLGINSTSSGEHNFTHNGKSGPGPLCEKTVTEMVWSGSESPAEWGGYFMPGKAKYLNTSGLCPNATEAGVANYTGDGPVAFFRTRPNGQFTHPGPYLQKGARSVVCALKCTDNIDCPGDRGVCTTVSTGDDSIPTMKICAHTFNLPANTQMCGNQTFDSTTQGCCTGNGLAGTGNGLTGTVYNLATEGCCEGKLHHKKTYTKVDVCGFGLATAQCKCGLAANGICSSSAATCCAPTKKYDTVEQFLDDHASESIPFEVVQAMNPAPLTTSTACALTTSEAWSGNGLTTLADGYIAEWRAPAADKARDKFMEPTLTTLYDLEIKQQEEEDAASNLMVHSVWAIVAISVIKHFAFVF